MRKKLLTNSSECDIIKTQKKKGEIKMTYAESMKILVELMIENQDVLKRLKECDNKYYYTKTIQELKRGNKNEN